MATLLAMLRPVMMAGNYLLDTRLASQVCLRSCIQVVVDMACVLIGQVAQAGHMLVLVLVIIGVIELVMVMHSR